MPSFRPPDIDPALTLEAQQVVNEASAKMENWLIDTFSSLEKDFDKSLEEIQLKLDAEKKAFIEEEMRQAQQLQQHIEQLKASSRFLTPMDPDQNAVIEKLNKLVEQAETDLKTREQRWTNFGSKAVSIAHAGVKTLLKGAL
jgi:vacuolar-type H+-ATPase subunit H